MSVEDRSTTPGARALDGGIEAVAWGVFLAWVGIALLADFGWAVGLIGAALITLGAQAWRRHRGLAVERFWLLVGAVLAICGIWSMFGVRLDLFPILLIVAGLALVASAWRAHHAHEGGGHIHPTSPPRG